MEEIKLSLSIVEILKKNATMAKNEIMDIKCER